MKVSAQWLREWVNSEHSNAEVAEKLTMAGLEVDSIEPAAPAFSGIVVAQVVSVEPHPDADKLRVCQVNKGDETVQIVCGAPNVAVDMLAPLATVGGVLSGQDGKPFKIKKAKLRGVESFGMLCSAVELGLAEQADGLWHLPGGLTVGDDLRQALQLDDDIIDIDLTPNRADALSMRGIAREVGVLTQSDVVEPVVNETDATSAAVFGIGIDAAAAAACPRYLLRVVENINNQVETPLWILERLRRAGISTLTPVVDVTNYVLLELGQPMHAFDRDKLQGDLRVRFAERGELIELLNQQTIKLDTNSLVIADEAGPVALAGVMGGLRTAVDEQTTAVVFESAHFTPETIAGRARQYGLHTDSSHRFERGVDPELPELAMQRATTLLADIMPLAAGSIVSSGTGVALPSAVTLRRQRIAAVLGIELSDSEILEILQRLDMQVSATADGWQVTPPSARFDIAVEVDLIEELVRVHGYDQVPVQIAHAPMQLQPQPEAIGSMASLRSVLTARDYYEAITYSFVNPDLQSQLHPLQPALTLSNPISADLSVMRLSTWPGLLTTLQHNVNRQQARCRLFETGLRFVPNSTVDAGNDLLQQHVLGGLAYGPVYAEQWDAGQELVDFYAVKADVLALFGRRADQIEFTVGEHAALHPGQTANIYLGQQAIGVMGALHPQWQKLLGLAHAPVLFEIDLSAIREHAIPAFEPISKFPTVRRDIALLVAESVPAAELQKIASATVAKTLKNVNCDSWVFDVFTGENIQSGHKSIALALVFQDATATLTDQQVEQAMSAVNQALQKALGAEIRA